MMSGFRVAFDRLEAERLGRLPEFVLAGRAVGPIEASLHTIEIVGRGPRDDEVDKSRLEDQADFHHVERSDLWRPEARQDCWSCRLMRRCRSHALDDEVPPAPGR